MNCSVYDKIKQAGTLPSPTGVALEILRLSANDATTLNEFAAVVEKDPAIAGRLLRLVNSSFAGVSRHIASVTIAVRLLGIRTVKNLALGFTLLGNHREGSCRSFDYNVFWSKSLARAVAGRGLAHRVKGFSPDEVFTLGLLSEVGRLGLATVFPKEYEQILQVTAPTDQVRLRTLEREAFGIDHGGLSAEMLKDWHFQEFLYLVIGRLQTDGEPQPPVSERSEQLLKILRAAEAIASVLISSATSPDSLREVTQHCHALGMPDHDVPSMFDVIVGEWKQAGQIFSVDTREVPSHEQLRSQAQSAAATNSSPPTSSVASPQGEESPLRILAVDDDPDALRLLAHYLTKAGHHVTTAANGAEALTVDSAVAPQMIITDWMMPEIDGLELCRRLRSHGYMGFVYIIVLTAQAEKGRVVEALNAGADDYLSKPYSREELLARVRAGQRIVQLQVALADRSHEIAQHNARLNVINDRLGTMSITDELTGLLNRREAMQRLTEYWSVALRHGDPLACIVTDLDWFKQLNDTHGHAAGDHALKETARRMKAVLRTGESACRMGGEEFLVLCPRASAEAAEKVADRLRLAVGGEAIQFEGHELAVTVSLGVAERVASMKSPEDLLKAADEAMYAAKAAGRDRVVVAGRPREASQPAVSSELTRCADLAAQLNHAKRELGLSNDVRWDQTRAFGVLLDLSCALTSAEDLDGILGRAVNAAAELTCCRRVSIMLPDSSGTHLVISKSIGIDDDQAAAVRVAIGEGIAGYVFQHGESVAVNRDDESTTQSRQYESAFFVSAPLVSKPLRANEVPLGVLNLTERHELRPFTAAELESIDLLCNVTATAISGLLSRQARDQARDSIVTALATLAEYRDTGTGRHLDRVTSYTMTLAHELRTTPELKQRIDGEFLESLRRAIPLHDIGKVTVPDHILLKPGKLTPPEITIMQRHAEMGATTLESVVSRSPDARFLRMAVEIARCHHERYDGSGYPQGLSREQIPLAARIASVADVYDALTSPRPYKEDMAHETAVSLIRAGAGSQFDPMVVAAFLKREADLATAARELADGRGRTAEIPRRFSSRLHEGMACVPLR